MPDETFESIHGSDVYTWYFTITEAEYNFLKSFDDSLVNDFKYHVGDLYYAKQSEITTQEYDDITGYGISFGEAWFTRSTEPNVGP